MKLNSKKTKEMIIDFKKIQSDIPPIIFNDEIIERVNSFKLLGVHISSSLKWQDHLDSVTSKCSKRLYFLRCLKRAGISEDDLTTYYKSVVRPVMEYACPVWYTSTTQQQKDELESLQKRALSIIKPGSCYKDALADCKIEPLQGRLLDLCKSFFVKMSNSSHRLNHLLPKNDSCRNLRSGAKFKLPKCHTKRFKQSFIPFCLFNFQ